MIAWSVIPWYVPSGVSAVNRSWRRLVEFDDTAIFIHRPGHSLPEYEVRVVLDAHGSTLHGCDDDKNQNEWASCTAPQNFSREASPSRSSDVW
jgi:hypothetical protein